ncbi:MAG: aconitate hydratase, partial [Actinomycetota bacterium]
VPSIAGPKRPQDRVSLSEAKSAFAKSVTSYVSDKTVTSDIPVSVNNRAGAVKNGSVVIASITSCTNTSNPTVMIGAGLLAKKAVERGLSSKPWVKTTLAPGSKVVTNYYEKAGLTPFLEKLGFNLVGYGCVTCIGNSGPLPSEVSKAVNDNDLAVAAVLSGNRNFEGRISPDVKMNYLASPPLVVAYALAGTMDHDFETDALGKDSNGNDVFLKDIWPTPQEIQGVIDNVISSDMFKRDYASVFAGDHRWTSLDTPSGEIFEWDANSTYVRKPPYFEGMPREPKPVTDIAGARVLAKLGDSVTTDHISPAGSIKVDSPAGKYLMEHDGSRRGNHEVMIRGTFANIRLKNLLLQGVEGGYTKNFMAGGEQTTIYDASMAYQAAGIPLVILAGKEYGSGSSRDWAAKGTALLGVKAVIAESFERIHRSNLIGMGVLPLQFLDGESAESLGLTGDEEYSISGITELNGGQVPKTVKVVASGKSFTARVRIDTPGEADYYRHGGIMQYVLRSLLG